MPNNQFWRPTKILYLFISVPSFIDLNIQHILNKETFSGLNNVNLYQKVQTENKKMHYLELRQYENESI